MNNIERRDKGLAYISDDTIMAEQATCRKILQKLKFMDRSDFAGKVKRMITDKDKRKLFKDEEIDEIAWKDIVQRGFSN